MRDVGPVTISRRGFLLTAATASLEDDSRRQVTDMFGDLGRALGAGDAYDALAFFDRSMPEYGRIQADIAGLLDQNEVLCSIEFGNMDVIADAARVETDWLLEIRSRQPAGGTVRRRATVAVRLARVKKKWRITDLRPADFFAPPVPGGKG